ncbi:MAG TPA: DUF3464 domain-containing protein, partial [Cyanothece sp. UBA12306]|nr:DUF3464 domain-containing protein [Cyanothece sp. UBA12306]
MASKSSPDSLPFEPRQKKKKAAKSPPNSRVNAEKTPHKPTQIRKNERHDVSLSAIPDSVSQRMVRRMALFSGIPTALGMSSFFVFYWIVSQEWLEIPT